MRANQFWILLLCSTIVSALMIKQIFLSRALNLEQRLLVDSQEVASTGSAYETAWKQLAIRIYQASHQDPALAEVLKNENVMIHSGSASGTSSTPATTPAPSPTPPASSKVPSGAPHPATP
jgi:hypothetical protein